jgi:hypothetical protein
MRSAQDSRLLELKRLQVALDDASRRLDEFEARVDRGTVAQGAKSALLLENKFALHIVAGMQKIPPKPLG